MRDDQAVDPAIQIIIDSPFVLVQEPSFVARFALGADEVDSVENVDAFVDLPDGSSWGLTIFTIEEVRRLLHSWKDCGEHANGSYFWAVGQLIVPRPGIAAMVTALRELVRTNDITIVGVPAGNHDTDTSNALP